MKLKVNLLPGELQPGEDTLKRLSLCLGGLLALALLTIPLYYCFTEIREGQAQLVLLQEERENLAGVEIALENLAARESLLENKLKPLAQLLDSRQTWSDMLCKLNDSIPGDINVTSLHLSAKAAESPENDQETSKDHSNLRPNTLLLRGQSASLESTGRLLYSLSLMPHLTSISLIETNRSPEGIYLFEISAALVLKNE